MNVKALISRPSSNLIIDINLFLKFDLLTVCSAGYVFHISIDVQSGVMAPLANKAEESAAAFWISFEKI